MRFFQLSYFNSIKVRLKLNIQTNTGRLMQFQFHKGTIKTISDFGTVVPNDISIP